MRLWCPPEQLIIFPQWSNWILPHLFTFPLRLVMHCPQFCRMTICDVRSGFRLKLASLFTADVNAVRLPETSSRPRLVKWLRSGTPEKNGLADQLEIVSLQGDLIWNAACAESAGCNFCCSSLSLWQSIFTLMDGGVFAMSGAAADWTVSLKTLSFKQLGQVSSGWLCIIFLWLFDDHLELIWLYVSWNSALDFINNILLMASVETYSKWKDKSNTKTP